MKYLIFPVFLIFLVISGCASPKPQQQSDVKVVPQEQSSAQPAAPAQETPAPADQPSSSPDTTTAPAVEAAPEESAEVEATEAADKEPVEGQQTHAVEPLETLWGISEKYYGDGNHWELILEANSDLLTDPKELRPKMELVIPPLEK